MINDDIQQNQIILSELNLELNQKQSSIKEIDLKLDILNFELSKYLKVISNSKGTLFNLFHLKESSKDYLLPLTIICYDLSTIVTTTSLDAKRILEKEQNIIIWSMDRIEKNDFHDRIISLKDKFEEYEILNPLDLLDFDLNLKNIFQRCFGNYVITKNDKISSEILEKYNISSITVSGTIHQKGTIKGGFRNESLNPLLKKKYSYQELIKEKEGLIKEEFKIKGKINQIKSKIQEMIQQRELNDIIQELKNNHEILKELLKRNHQKLNEMNREFEHLNLQLNIKSHQFQEILNEIKNNHSKEWIENSIKMKNEKILKLRKSIQEMEISIENEEETVRKRKYNLD